MKRLAVCADDFGHSAAVDRGILALVLQGRLSEVSCLVGFAAWPRDAAALAATGVRCGLHLNLSEGSPLSPRLAARWPQWPSLPRLILRAHLGALPRDLLREELQCQLAAFERAFGRAPDHLDGHQHVHHLPGVRGLLAELLRQRPGLRVRHTGRVDGPGHAVKRWLIAATGGRALGATLRAQGRQLNERLLGVYDFRQADYRALVRAWLAALPASGGLLFCHPGDAAAPGDPSGPPDPIAAARLRERAYLASEAFAADLAAAGVAIAAGDAAVAAPAGATAPAGAAARTTSAG